jgi:hypothetical protein
MLLPGRPLCSQVLALSPDFWTSSVRSVCEPLVLEWDLVPPASHPNRTRVPAFHGRARAGPSSMGAAEQNGVKVGPGHRKVGKLSGSSHTQTLNRKPVFAKGPVVHFAGWLALLDQDTHIVPSSTPGHEL